MEPLLTFPLKRIKDWSIMDFPPPNPALAAEEAARLAREIATPEGEKRIDDALLAAATVPIGRLFGAGIGMAGVAIDTETEEFLAGPFGGRHNWAFERLVEKAGRRTDDCDRSNSIVVKGHAALIDGYATPVVTLYAKYINDPSKDLAEKLVLERGHCIPVWPIKVRYSSNRELRASVAEIQREINQRQDEPRGQT